MLCLLCRLLVAGVAFVVAVVIAADVAAAACVCGWFCVLFCVLFMCVCLGLYKYLGGLTCGGPDGGDNWGQTAPHLYKTLITNWGDCGGTCGDSTSLWAAPITKRGPPVRPRLQTGV